MKLIMETWKRYLEESQYITFDESQLRPSFFENLALNEEAINKSVDTDPESLSIKDLQRKSDETIQKIFKNMLKIETADRIETRLTKYKPLEKRSNELERLVKSIERSEKEQTLSGAGDSIGDKIKLFINKIFGTKLITSKIKNAETKAEFEEISKQIENIFIGAFGPMEREIIRAIVLFTGGHVATVRAPEEFDPAKAEVYKMVNDGLVDIFTPSKETFQKANIILNKIIKTPIAKKTPVWRGLALPEKTGKFPGLETYTKGKTISVGNIVSFSIDPEVAKDFADRMAQEADYYDENTQSPIWRTILHVPALKRGADVDEFSEFEDVEKEIIVSGKFKITDMGWAERFMGMSSLEDIKQAVIKTIGDHDELNERLVVHVILEQI